MADALAPRKLSGGATRVEWVPHGVVAAILPFNWPVSVMANKILPALLAGDTVVVKAPPTCPGAVLLVAAAMAEALPPGVLNVVNGPDAALGAALVGHPGVDMVSFTGGVRTGQAVMAAAAATTRPVVLELGGNDPAILAPDVEADAALADRLVEAAFVTSGQVCMAIKRLYVHRDRMDETVDALADRLSARGRRRRPGRRGDDGARAHGGGPRPGRGVRRGGRGGRGGGAPAGTAARRGRGLGRATSSRRRSWWRRRPRSKHRARGAVRPGAPRDPLRRHRRGGRRGERHRRSACARRCGATTTRSPPTWRRGLDAGTVFVNAHGISSIDMYAPMGGWKQSGFGVELGTEGMQAFARQRVRVRRPGPGTDRRYGMTVAIRGGTVVDGTGAPPSAPTS